KPVAYGNVGGHRLSVSRIRNHFVADCMAGATPGVPQISDCRPRLAGAHCRLAVGRPIRGLQCPLCGADLRREFVRWSLDSLWGGSCAIPAYVVEDEVGSGGVPETVSIAV